MEIKPSYVTFEQAKLLKEKGFKQIEMPSYLLVSYEKISVLKINPNNLKIGDLIGYYIPRKTVNAPGQHIVVEWLRIKHGIWVVVNIGSARNGYYATYTKVTELGMDSIRIGDYNLQSPQEAYSSAFDYILKELI